MRRIDVIGITFGIFVAGGMVYLLLQVVGLDGIDAGIWTQLVLALGIVGWTATYLFRVVTRKMTYHQQLKDYEDAVLQKRLDEMSPEELAQLQQELEQERLAAGDGKET